MKQLLCFILCFCYTSIYAQSLSPNMALHLDGKDNNVRTGIGFINGSWTLEAWIKGDDDSWKDLEVIFGGGEYSRTNRADNLPLVVQNGKLHSTWADLWSEDVIDNAWHHVALSCDGEVTKLYLDGVVLDSKVIAISVLPGALGVNEENSTTFGGLIDEVRIWNSCVPTDVLNEWMNKPLDSYHPYFKSLVAYYNFDDGFIEDVSVNWVGKGDQAYHLRNTRNNYKGSAPFAYMIVNNNPNFEKPYKCQTVFNSVVIESEWDVDKGTNDDQILKLRIAVTGDKKPLSLTELSLNLSEVSNLSDISCIHVYYTGKSARSNVKTELFGSGKKPEKKMLFKDNSGSSVLATGINYFLVTADIRKNAQVGDIIKISVSSFKLGKTLYIPEKSKNNILKKIGKSSMVDSNIIKVLQWNIWHGGNHVGSDGPSRIIDLIKSTSADIVTMQEGYGTQQRIRDSLNFYIKTPSFTDNLVLLSRYPFNSLSTKKTFNSNPAIIMLPNNRKLLVNSCWLRYADKPEYTSDYPCIGHEVRDWVIQDSIYGLEDIKNIYDNDTKPYLEIDDMPVIIGGDFNSCSHLDWTKAAAPIHFGYGPVAFPISKYLIDIGYKDSFREINPDEIARPEGTFAVIYGQIQVSRIDFIYYTGKNIRAISSKIVKTAHEIDDVWASDHAAVLTTFELK